MLRFKVERSRWLGAVAQPLLFWAMIGFGMGRHFTFASGPGTDGAAGYQGYFFPGSLVMVVLFTTMFASMSIIEDRNTGFLQAVLVRPGARLGVLLGKIASVTTLALLQVALFLLASPLAGYSLLDFAAGSLLFALMSGTVGLAALSLAGAWILNSISGYHSIMAILLFPLWILSGAMFPLESGWQSIVGLVNPLSYFVVGVRLAMRGESLFTHAHLPVLAGLVVVVLVTFTAAFLFMRRTGVQAV
jgi:ABC-2 type transport system permease protein